MDSTEGTHRLNVGEVYGHIEGTHRQTWERYVDTTEGTHRQTWGEVCGHNCDAVSNDTHLRLLHI